MLALLALPTSINAANSIWTLDESAAQWGTWRDGVNGVGYTGPYTEYGTFTNTDFPRNGNHTNEGPIDGEGMIIGTSGQLGTATYVNSSSNYDLSSVGDSVTFQFGFHYLDKYAANDALVGYTNNDFTLFEVGLTSTGTGVLGSAGDDSFFFAGRNTTSGVFNQGDVGTFEIATYTDSTIGGTDDGQSLNAGDTLQGNMVLDAVHTNGGTTSVGQTGVSHFYNLTITHKNATEFTIDYEITEFDVVGLTSAGTATPTGTVYTGTQDRTHDLNDLTSLDLAIGVRGLQGDAPISGATFDMNRAFSLAVPEPSVFTFSLFSALGMLAYRRR